MLDIRGKATAKLAGEFVEAVIARMPFPIKALQVDNGGELKAELEEVCQARGLKLFVLPPRSPKLNGHVERAQRTWDCSGIGWGRRCGGCGVAWSAVGLHTS